MKCYKQLFLIFLAVLFFEPCSSQNLVKIDAGKQSYIDYILSLSDTDRKERLETDAAEIDSIRAIASNWRICYRFSISMTSGSIPLKAITKNDSVSPFAIPSEDDILSEFQQLDSDNIHSEQIMSLPNSAIKVRGAYRFDYIKDNFISYNPKQLFMEGQLISMDKVGLQKMDSMCVEVSCTYPTSFDTLKLTRNQPRNITYKDDSLSVQYDSKRKNTLSIEYPLGMTLLGYQAISDNGILMNSIGYSNFPVYSLNPNVESILEKTSQILKEAAMIKNQDACKEYIENIPEYAGKYIKKIIQRIEEVKSLDNKISLKDFRSKYGDVLTANSLQNDLTFPAELSEVLLYIRNDSKTVSREIGANIYQDPDNEGYFAFYDAEKELYGIADTIGNVVIPATYNDLSKSGLLYFDNRDKKKRTQGYYLNETRKELESLPEGLTYNSLLSNGLAVFENEDEYRGVLLNNSEEIIPFMYDAIAEVGNMLCARRSIRGRSFWEFFTKNATKLDLPRIKEFSETFNKKFIIVSMGREKYGVIDADGKQTIPFEYYSLSDLSDNLFKYDTRRKLTYGLISAYGEIITEPIFSEIDKFSEGLASVEMKEDRESKQGYINEKGKVIITPQFYSAEDFVDGHALVCHTWRNEYQLIDKKGDIVKEFPKDIEIEAVRDVFGLKILYYESSEGEKYSTKGELIK